MAHPPTAHPRAHTGEPPGERARTVLLVAGAGRSGTSTMAGLMQTLGLHVPQPEVLADETNPKGFGEPRWVVDHHNRLMGQALVLFNDARPAAWTTTAEVSAREAEQQLVADWLAGHLAEHDELVVKDPRLGWFLPLWRAAATRTDATAVFATMLRPPAEVIGSKQTYYAGPLGPTQLGAAWLNMMLHTEQATRPARDGDARVFVRYADLLTDWRGVTTSAAERLGLRAVARAGEEQLRRAEAFVDPSLRRVSHDLADLGLPPRLRDLTAQTWAELDRLAAPDGDTPAAHAALDQLREAYVDLYSASEAISRSSSIAAEIRERRRLAALAKAEPSAAERVPHRVRALVPGPVRRGLRRALRRPR